LKDISMAKGLVRGGDVASRGPFVSSELCSEMPSTSGVGPVKIHKSFNLERFVKEIEVRRVNVWESREVRRERMWVKESVAKVSC
jgi:hypothetical protein